MPIKYSRALLALVVFAVLTISCAPGNKEAGGDDGSQAVAKSESTAPPPLVVDTSEPLLLDEPDKNAVSDAGNQTCLVCHSNFANEELAVTHLARDITCRSCHGESIKHKNDENNTTPPDKMYPRDSIRAMCAKCHKPHRITAARIRERLGKNPKDVVVNDLVCTDCHGKHRMKVRTVIWDKQTGKLIKTNRGN